MAPLTKSERDQITRLETRLGAIEGKLSRIQNIVVGIAIGIGIGAVIFGVISFKELFNAVK